MPDDQTTAPAAGGRGRDRAHLFPGRPHQMGPRFSAQEFAEIRRAAAAAGVTPNGYVAEACLAYARGTRPSGLEPEREQLAALQSQLFEVRTSVSRIGTNLNQAVAGLNASGVAPDWLHTAAALCERRMTGVDDLIGRIDKKLRIFARRPSHCVDGQVSVRAVDSYLS